MFEVQVYSSGINVATKKSSSQSSTLNNFGASLAVDGKNNTFSHTNVAASGGTVWWKVDLGKEFHVESVTILNRWCGSSSDPSGCLCRLSFATLFLIDSKGAIVATQSFGDTCGKGEVSFDNFLVAGPLPTLTPSYSPTSSFNPTNSLVEDFSLVGQGFCYDQSNQYYSWVESSYLPAHTSDTYCLDWCSQNPHPDLVGVEIYRWTNLMYCLCDFNGGIPDIIQKTDYSPAAWGLKRNQSGVGGIEMANGDSNAVCYRYAVSVYIAVLNEKGLLAFIPSNFIM